MKVANHATWVEVPVRILMLVDPEDGPVQLKFEFADGDERVHHPAADWASTEPLVRMLHVKVEEIGGVIPW
jgi:hypothetical protein